MTARDPLAVLEVLDRLEVGPVELRRDRLSAPYRVVRGDSEDVLDLTYSYRQPVFDPEAPGDRNLASMIAAQVALNYGLFCRKIVFRGLYTGEDRRFLRHMMANTAREIYVKKLLQHNPYLKEEVRGLPALKRRDYVRAELVFEPSTEAPASGFEPWHTERDRYSVLSSGGKDSLLSYGLLTELGYETHPVFVNESGRHWLTALRAFRHFEREVPHTARVWTNSDRVFAWMLRHLPFIREDFQRLRADEYPIRLWTVAVFLFGVLPVLRARGIGRLVIGDEHDTTVEARHQGIPHYDGLYDQSRFFDNALSRYYLRKGWGVSQFSLLRPLSEVLIEKLLAERYPHLLRLQLSCHSAHKEGDEVLPCGRCEKCRRIVGMLRAFDADPAVCGYTEAQQEHALAALVDRGVHQEKPAAEHLAHLLSERGLLAEPRIGEARAHQRPEVVKLRFHPDKSPIGEIPVKLRRPLYEIFRAHGEGMLVRTGRRWREIERFGDEIQRPYPFDPPPAKPADEDAAEGYLWGELSWPQAARRLEQVDTALLPVGAIEQHGPHLPLDVDAYDAERIAKEVAAACSEPRPLVLPLVPYGVSYHHDEFRGTVSVSNETLSRLVYEIGISVARNGINKLVIVNGHGGNGPALHFAAQMINRDAHIFTCVDTGETSDAEIDALAETPNDVHAGEIETSTTLALRPHLVQMDKARSAVSSFSSPYLDFSSSRGVGWYAYTDKLSETGILGDATKASKEKGERMWQVMVDRLRELVEHLKGLSLEEIYQRRY
jgi:creatinine amidohydrolase/Fe(II)-dependent formamide hydrolase-like protein